MYTERARVLHTSIPADRRIIVISDIHGNLPYFDGLMAKLSPGEKDLIIFNGDFLEKGEDSLGMLRRVMHLCKEGRAMALLGNCDYWTPVFVMDREEDARFISYVRKRRSGIVFEMLKAIGVDPLSIDSFFPYAAEIRSRFSQEWDFLDSLPFAIETENYIFTHAGLDPSKPLDENSIDDLSERSAFLFEGRVFDKWVITGHWPCVLYRDNIVNANPVIDPKSHIVCIDGGCVLKDDGQLNAFIIPSQSAADAQSFSWVYYDPFPAATVLEEQTVSAPSWYIRWGDSTVQVLSRGEEFSRCRHVRTGYEMDILTKYLFTSETITGCNDCTDYILPLHCGDTVAIIEETSRGYFVKHKGISGWYFGKLRKENSLKYDAGELSYSPQKCSAGVF